jgi:hypothetical protein
VRWCGWLLKQTFLLTFGLESEEGLDAATTLLRTRCSLSSLLLLASEKADSVRDISAGEDAVFLSPADLKTCNDPMIGVLRTLGVCAFSTARFSCD